MVSFRKGLEQVCRVIGRLAVLPIVAYQGYLLNNLVRNHHDNLKTSYLGLYVLDILNCLAFAVTLVSR